MGSMMQHVERKLQYRCNSGSGNVMGSSTGSSNVGDVRQQARHQTGTDAEDQCDISIVKH